MTTLIELRNKLNDMIENNPDAADYRVISFDNDHRANDDVLDEPFISTLLGAEDFYGMDELCSSDAILQFAIKARPHAVTML